MTIGWPEGAEFRRFSGVSLREVAFPLGGIGTGTVSLGGRGNLRDWEIFNRPAKGRDLPYTFFSLWARRGSEAPIARVLERRILPPYTGGFGLPTARVSGLPRLKEAHFRGFYPYARIDFEDDVLPVEVRLEAWNPFAPHDADLSGMPVALFQWTLHNPGGEPVDAALAMSLLNAVGLGAADGTGNQYQTGNRHAGCFGGNLNRFVEMGGFRGLEMSGAKYAADDAAFGTMALLTDHAELTHTAHWERAGWWDDLQHFWDDFSADGALEPAAEEPSPEGQTDVGSLALRVRLAPGETRRLNLVLAWHFPNLHNQWNGEEAVRGRRLGNYYGQQFRDARHAAETALQRLPELEQATQQYVAALSESTLPAPVLDAVSSQASILRTTTGLRTEDGRFHAFEGCGDTVGCCPMNCTHVWNYEQALAHLFPALERTMRLTDFGINTRPDGRMAFRTLLPLSPETLWGGPPAADGQMGCLLKLYREWKLSGDTAWLGSLWEHAKAALAYAWQKWDLDRDGVMEGEQHNTYDIEFYGPNTMMGTFYLAALRAMAEMALAMGEPETAAALEEMHRGGGVQYDELLWNGEFYRQQVVPPAGPVEGLGEGTQSVQASGEIRYQYGPGCLTDQLLGQWFARVVGLGEVLPQAHVREALRSIYRYNFRRDLSEHANCQRIYALNDEAGTLLCSWPQGGRPAYPFPYADEVWTGIEYQVAAHMIYEGLVDEGIEVASAVRARYDGDKRNPWNEVECGHHYARAMASWSLLLALSGFHWDGVIGALQFQPVVQQDQFRCFFSTGTAWGVFEQARVSNGWQVRLHVHGGELRLRALSLAVDAAAVDAQVGGAPAAAAVTGGVIRFDEPARVAAGEVLEVGLS